MAAAGLLIWFVIAAWLLFGGSGYIDLALAMISVLVFMAVVIPLALWRTSLTAQRSDGLPHAAEENIRHLRQMVTWPICDVDRPGKCLDSRHRGPLATRGCGVRHHSLGHRVRFGAVDVASVQLRILASYDGSRVRPPGGRVRLRPK
jgi:hypothetical protein